MELDLFIDRVLTENNKPCTVEDVKKVKQYIIDKARKKAVGRCAAIEDAEVEKWILEYEPGSENKEQKVEEKKEETNITEQKPKYTPIEFKPKKIRKDDTKGSWGEQESLF